MKDAAGQIARTPQRPAGRVVRVRAVFGLLPDPGNEYNEQAIAVVVPTPDGQLTMARQVGWIRDGHLRSLAPSILGLMMDASEASVGFEGHLQLSVLVPGESYDGAEEFDGEDQDGPPGPPFPSWKFRRTLGLDLDGFHTDIPGWEKFREAVLGYIVEHVQDRLIPMTSHRAPRLDQSPARGKHLFSLRAEGGVLEAIVDGVVVARLHPQPRDFFVATYDRVRELGGFVRAEGLLHAQTVEVSLRTVVCPARDPNPGKLYQGVGPTSWRGRAKLACRELRVVAPHFLPRSFSAISRLCVLVPGSPLRSVSQWVDVGSR